PSQPTDAVDTAEQTARPSDADDQTVEGLSSEAHTADVQSEKVGKVTVETVTETDATVNNDVKTDKKLDKCGCEDDKENKHGPYLRPEDIPADAYENPDLYHWHYVDEIVDYDTVVDLDESEPGHINEVIEYILSKHPERITDNENHLLNFYLGTKRPGAVVPKVYVPLRRKTPKKTGNNVRFNNGTPTKEPPFKRRDLKATPELCRSNNTAVAAERDTCHHDRTYTTNGTPPTPRVFGESEVPYAEADVDTCSSDSSVYENNYGRKAFFRHQKANSRPSTGSTADDAIDVDAIPDTKEDDRKPAARQTKKNITETKPTPMPQKKKFPPVASLPRSSSSSPSSSTL
ncbi:hypothetical protein (Partial), partial [Seminavis robusta]